MFIYFRFFFAGVQSGGLACLDDEGMVEINKLMDYYLENAKILKEVCTLTEKTA